MSTGAAESSARPGASAREGRPPADDRRSAATAPAIGGRKGRRRRTPSAVDRPRLTSPLVRNADGVLVEASWDEALDRASAGLATARERGPRSYGMFSCSKATNEVNYLAQKFSRVVMGSNNIDSCNRT